jgi:hypothetical protein
MTGGRRVSLWFLLGGLLAMALSDSAYAYLAEVQDYATGNLIDAGWIAGYLCIGLGAYFAKGDMTRRGRRSGSLLPSIVTPFLPVLLALSVAGIETELGHRPDRVAVLMVLVLVMLVLSRQALLLLSLVRSPSEPGASLSDRIAQIALGGPEPSELGPVCYHDLMVVKDARA